MKEKPFTYCLFGYTKNRYFLKKRYNLFKKTLNKTKFDKYIKLTSLSNKQYNKFESNKWF